MVMIEKKIQELKEMAYRVRNFDCSEIADELQGIIGGGTIWNITNKVPLHDMKVLEYGELMDYKYHMVYEKDGKCLDLRYQEDWMSFDQYIREIKELNKKYGIEIIYMKEG